MAMPRRQDNTRNCDRYNPLLRIKSFVPRTSPMPKEKIGTLKKKICDHIDSSTFSTNTLKFIQPLIDKIIEQRYNRPNLVNDILVDIAKKLENKAAPFVEEISTKENLAVAREYYLLAIRKCYRFGEHLNYLGLIYEFSNQKQEAIICYSAAIKTQPKKLLYYQNRGSLLLTIKGCGLKGIKDFHHIIKVGTLSFRIRAYSHIAFYYLSIGKIQQGYDLYLQVLLLEPENELAKHRIVWASHRLLTEMETHVLRLLTSPVSQNQLTGLQLLVEKITELQHNQNQGQIDKLLTVISDILHDKTLPFVEKRESIEKEQLMIVCDYLLLAIQCKQTGDHWNNLGLIYLELNQYPEALACYDEIIKSEPACLDSYTNRGAVWAEMQGHELDAIKDFQHVINHTPDELSLPAYKNMAACYIRLGELEKACKACRKILKLDPENKFALDNIKWIQAQDNYCFKLNVDQAGNIHGLFAIQPILPDKASPVFNTFFTAKM